MVRRRSASASVPPLPPKLNAYLREHGIELADPAMAALFTDGVRVAEEAIRAEERWMRDHCRA